LLFEGSGATRHWREAEQFSLRGSEGYVLAGIRVAEEWSQGEADVGCEEEGKSQDGVGEVWVNGGCESEWKARRKEMSV
jgi:hypothetical protein